MGKVFSCDRCELTSETSVFTFSQDLVLKLADGILPAIQDTEKGKPKDLNDREWMERLLCIDNSHTHMYGLSEEGFEELVSHLQRRLDEFEGKAGRTSRDKVIECYTKNPECTIRCNSVVDEYLDSVDLARVKKMKQFDTDAAEN